VCQPRSYAPKLMKLLAFMECVRGMFDIESSSSSAAGGAQGHRLTFFVMTPKSLGSQSFQRSDELFVVAPALHGTIVDFLPHLPSAGRINGPSSLMER
jgi:hypothetical protein